MQEKKPSKRKTPAHEAEKAVFATKLRECMKVRSENQTTLAKKIGVQRQTISLYMNGQSSPNTETLADIASTLNVSADYLLGLSEVPQVNSDLKAAQKYTGMTPDALQNIRELSNVYWSVAYTRLDPKATISRICENKKFYGLIYEIAAAMYYKQQPKMDAADFITELTHRIGPDKMAAMGELEMNDWINMVYPINAFFGTVSLESDEAAKHHITNACNELQKIVEELMNEDKDGKVNHPHIRCE